MNLADIRLLIARVRDVEQCYGTLTDKTMLSGPADGPMIFPPDLALFKQVVENNVMAAPEFRAPMGYKVLDFLTMLSLKQEADRAKTDREQKAELNQIYRKHFPKTV